MTCRELIEFLMEYTAGELSPEVKAEFERHLSICRSCAAYLDSYRKTVELAKESHMHAYELPVTAVPPGLVNAINQARKKQADVAV